MKSFFRSKSEDAPLAQDDTARPEAAHSVALQETTLRVSEARNQLLLALGEMYFKAHREGTGETRAMLRKIRELEKLEREGLPKGGAARGLAEASVRPSCRCGMPIEPKARYCSHCGAEFAQPRATVAKCRTCELPAPEGQEQCEKCVAQEQSTRKVLVRHPLTGQETSFEATSTTEKNVQEPVGLSDAKAVAQVGPAPPADPEEPVGQSWTRELERFARPATVDTQVLVSRGREYLQMSRYREAIVSFETALGQNPRDGRALHHLGVARYQSGLFEDAMEAFLKAARLDKDNPDVHNGIGLCHRRLGQPKEALESYLEALRLAPAHADAHYNIAQVYLQTGRASEAVVHLQNYLQYSPRARDFQQVVEVIEQLTGGRGGRPDRLRLSSTSTRRP